MLVGMNTHQEQAPALPGVAAGREESRQGEQTDHGIRQAAAAGVRLMADFSAFLTRRSHGRMGLYLPLVRVDSGDSGLH
jgi:hypothetical protein